MNIDKEQKRYNRMSIAIFIALQILAIESGIYTYVLLHHRELSHVVLLTILLCLLAAIVARLVTHIRSQWHIRISKALLLFGLLSTAIGIYTRIAFTYHERAALALGTGLICLLAGFSGLLLARSLRAVLYEGIVLGLIALGLGFYFLIGADHVLTAYLIIGTGLLCLLCSLSATVRVANTPHAHL
jgi:hypothetical protein